ncbi:LicD family protein [Desulfatibacillum aliphaticivorans]|uniref:LicD family protein n=1 Tax=Desulfatibacillum aliphaticivorans TaxID=218208 RepID=B8F9S5_DESAL|nr:LicD family protein [Desulfatibacillum aliphaticivorans]ACL03021.1 LicD family protein [Desulfatibacillum aliphaticivorans]
MSSSNETSFAERSDVERMAPAILEILDVFKENGINCWLNYGALLGMVREGRLLPWNNDAELCFWYTDEIAGKLCKITDILNQKGYHAFFYSSIGAVSTWKKGVNINLNGVWTEGEYAVRPHETPHKSGAAPLISQVLYWCAVFMGTYPSGFAGNNGFRVLSKKEMIKVAMVSFFRLFPGRLRKKWCLSLIKWAAMTGGRFQKTAVPANLYSSMILIDFYGSRVPVPEKAESLIELIYGEDWNVPKESWSFYHDKNKSKSGIRFLDEPWNYSEMEIV